MPYVAGGKHAGDVGLQIIRIALQRPVLGRSADQQVRPGDEIAGFIALNAHFRGPIGMRHPPDADKQPTRCECLPLAGIELVSVISRKSRLREAPTLWY